MGFELSSKAVFYIVLTLILVVVGVSVLYGSSPSQLFTTLHQTFEPGKLFLAGDSSALTKLAKFDCSGTAYIITLDSLKFNYLPKGGEKEIEFAVVLNYNGVLFLGRDADDGSVFKCDLKEKEFDCPQSLQLQFRLGGVSAPTGIQAFHFTMWQANPFVMDAIKQAEECKGASGCKNFNDIVNSYADFYLSSFDVQANVSIKCREAACQGKQEGDCRANNDKGCYWDTTGINSCELCPAYGADCNRYDGDQCTQCTEAKANCKPGTIYGCEAK